MQNSECGALGIRETTNRFVTRDESVPTLSDRFPRIPSKADESHHEVEGTRADPSLLEIQYGGHLTISDDVVGKQITMEDSQRQIVWDLLAQPTLLIPESH